MKRYPLEMLIKARQVRLDQAARELSLARAALNEKLAHEADVAARRQAKQAQYDHQRLGMLDADTPIDPATFAFQFSQREMHLELLLDQLADIDQELFDAKVAVEQAREGLRVALAHYNRVQAKLELLVERKRLWRNDLERTSDELDEQNAEEIFMSKRLQEQAHASTSSRH
jgi:hypothetical protein